MNQVIYYLRRMLPTNRLRRGVFVLVGGTAGGQIIAFLAAPILTRAYRPEDFGLLSVFIGIVAIVGAFAGSQYVAAILLPDNDKDANALFLLSVLIVLGIGGLTSIPVFLFPKEIGQLLNTPELADFLYLLPLGVLCVGISYCFNEMATREKAFTSIANTKVAQAVATQGIQLAGANFGASALLIGQVAGLAVGSVSLMFRILRRRWHQFAHVRASTVLEVAYAHKRLALFDTWTGVFNVVGGQLPSILLAILFGPAAAGMYALTSRVLYAPVQLLGQAISQVFSSRVADLNREGKLGTSTAALHSHLTHISIPPTLMMVVSAPEIFSLFFGPQWRDAGVFAQWLAPWFYLVFITTSLPIVFIVLGKLGTALMFELVSLSVRALAIIVGTYIGDVMIAVALLAIGSIVTRASMLVWLMRITGNPWNKIWRPPFSALLWSIFLVSPTILSKIWGVDSTFWFIALGATSVLIVARYACLMKKGLGMIT